MNSSKLALYGGTPVRKERLPYGRQSIDSEDEKAVLETLRSDWLTTGPRIDEFEQAFSTVTGASEAIAVNSGTAALHAAVFALNIQRGDEVIVSAMTFAASANCVVYQGGIPVFADIDPDTLLIDIDSVESKISSRTKAIIAVDYAGQPCDYDALQSLADKYGLRIIADACHALGGSYQNRPVGTLADLSTFSLHPVKHITSGEGGMITTADPELAKRMRVFRNHGISTDHRQRDEQGSWFYEMLELGYNYRLTDIQCALGISQLRKLPKWVIQRQAIAQHYNQAFSIHPAVKPLRTRETVSHAYHLYVIRLNRERLSTDRKVIFEALRAEGLGTNVHYIPVYLHPYYKSHFGCRPGLCPMAEAAYNDILSLPIFPTMTDTDLDDVIEAVCKVTGAFAISL